MLSMMPRLRSLTIDRWYPINVSSGDRKWFDELPLDEQNLRLTHDTKVPAELWSLPNLEELRFYDCYDPSSSSNSFFRSIPQDVTKLVKLKHLVLSRCGLETVEEPLDQGVVPGKFSSENLERSVLAKLTGLQTLGLPGNSLKRIPETIGYCTSLTRLSIGSNKLECLPDAILMLSNLKELWAQDNYIWKVPVSLTKYCPQLEDLRILQQGDDEKKSSLIPGDEKELKSLREQEKTATASGGKVKFGGVVKYMKQFLSDHKTIRLNRYKLVVVGDGAVGKTTTIRNLQQHAASSYKKKKNENILDNVATDGIAIQTLRLPANAKRTPGFIGGNECLNFSCWDFAGQDVYTYSHTFFMTEKSIYLIGFDCALGDSGAGIERVDYWLQVVRTRFPNAYCVVFGTHIDEVGKEEFKALQKKIIARYKSSGKAEKKSSTASVTGAIKKDLFKVSNIEFISNSTGKGLQELISDIKKFPTYLEKTRRKKNTDEEIPLSWLILEERGKAKGATRLVPIVQWSEWQQMAQMELNMDETQLKEATAHWHETGSLSWFDEDGLRDIVCLRPEFLTDVFSAVISAKTGLSSGILKHEALIQIWKGLPLYLYPHFLTILEKFEILHKLEGGVLDGADLFASGTDAKLFTIDAFMAPPMPLSPATGGVVNQGGVVIDFGAVSNGIGVGEVAKPTSSVFSGRSIIPAMLPEMEPPLAELEKVWPELPKGANELVRFYTFDFVPNGFFARLLVRLLHSKWKASTWWRWGIILSKNMAKLYLRYEGRTRTMSLRVRGPNNVAKVGSLIDSISTLISDWLQQAEITIKIPFTYPDGAVVEFDWKDVEKAAQSGQMMVPPPASATASASPSSFLPPVRIDNLAPDLALLTNSAKVFSEQELNVGKELGRGGFAVVLKGTLPTGEPVACKKLIFDKTQEETGETTFSDVFTEFRREVWLMSGLQHEHLVRLLGVVTRPNMMMVLEFMEGGTLHDFVHGDSSKEKANLSLEDKFALALGCAKGMQFMHGLNPPIIHRDLKSPNILMTYRGPKGEKLKLPVPKIADFGLSRGMQWTSSMNDKAVDNPVWLAPEVMMRKPYNEKSDVYSFGVILYEIVLQQRFLEDIKFDYQKEDAIKQGKRPPIPPETNPILSSLIQFCWAQDPNQRPSFDQIVECLEKKTVIQSARPSKLNYGTGFEDFDVEMAPKATILPHNPSRLQMNQLKDQMTALGAAPAPLTAPVFTQQQQQQQQQQNGISTLSAPVTPHIPSQASNPSLLSANSAPLLGSLEVYTPLPSLSDLASPLPTTTTTTSAPTSSSSSTLMVPPMILPGSSVSSSPTQSADATPASSAPNSRPSSPLPSARSSMALDANGQPITIGSRPSQANLNVGGAAAASSSSSSVNGGVSPTSTLPPTAASIPRVTSTRRGDSGSTWSFAQPSASTLNNTPNNGN
jgi:serine/threonine protein kinase/Leucine-rich repeat (LRR) protein/GTPase SAR1 family protein